MSVAVKFGMTPLTPTLAPSRKVIVMVEVATPSATTGPEPLMLEFAATTDPGPKITVPPLTATGIKRERVFVSAVVEPKLQVDVPVASLEEQAP